MTIAYETHILEIKGGLPCVSYHSACWGIALPPAHWKQVQSAIIVDGVSIVLGLDYLQNGVGGYHNCMPE